MPIQMARGNPTSYNIETPTIILQNPTREGYSFEGWYSDSEFKTQVTQIVKGSTGDKVLYAKWEKNVTPSAPTPEEQIQAFVERMYTVALGRTAEPAVRKS